MPPEFQPQAPTTQGQPSWMAPIQPVVPDHELVRRIGGGSYGDVWLARTTVGAWRAVKVVFRDRFLDARPYEREFNGIQKFEPLSRANEAFVDILQIGRNETDGYFYYVMELADDAALDAGGPRLDTGHSAGAAVAKPSLRPEDSRGQRLAYCAPHPASSIEHPEAYVPRTLSKVLLQRGRLPVSECLDLGLTLNLGLAHLHKAGLIHRDIKPSNIIFVNGVPKLADIGLVAEMSEARSFVGTEGFIPPEGPNSSQADLYSLGKVLYEAGMGKDRKDFPEPFTHLAETPDATELLEFNAILLKACAANREKRYQSAEEMNADLALLQSGGSVRRQRKLAVQLRRVQRIGVLTAALALLIGASWWWQARQTAVVQKLADEKNALAGSLTRLDAENRDRIVRLDIASGNRLLADGDPAGALLWFADALPRLQGKPEDESIHRIRIQQTLEQTPRVLRVFAHQAGVVSGAFSPDGRRVATGTENGELRLWDAQSGDLVWRSARLQHPVRTLRFSKDGQKLFASSVWEQGLFNGEQYNTAAFAVMDVATGRVLFPGGAESSGVFANAVCAHFSPDDRWLGISVGNAIRIYDVGTARQVAELQGHAEEVRFLSFSGDGTLLASASLDRTVRLWHLPSGRNVGVPLEHRWPVVRVLLSEDGKRAASASFAKPGSAGLGQNSVSEIQAWDVETSRRMGDSISGGGWPLLFMAPAGHNHFFAKGEGTGLRAFSFETGQPIEFQPALEAAEAWAFSRDGIRLALGAEFVAQVLDATTGGAIRGVFRHRQGSVSSIAFSPVENQLLTTSSDGCARLWSLRPLPSPFVSAPTPAPLKLVYSTRMIQQLGRRQGAFPVNLSDNSVGLFDEGLNQLGRFVSVIPGKYAESPQRAWRSDLWAIPHFEDGAEMYQTLVLSDSEPAIGQKRVIESPVLVRRDTFTLDDRFLITYGEDKWVRLWRTSDGGLDRTVTLPGLKGGHVMELSPDGKTVFSLHGTSDTGTALLPPFRGLFLDLTSGQAIGDWVDLPRTVFEAFFSPDASRLAVLESNGGVLVLESRTGRIISSLIRHSSNLQLIFWSPDSRRLLTVGYGNEVLVWDAETGTQSIGPLRPGGKQPARARWSTNGQFIVAYCGDGPLRVWDANSGEAVTPPLTHPGVLNFGFMTGNRRVITATLPDRLHALELKESALPADVLSDYAKLLSGSQLNSAGVMLALPPNALAEISRSLRVSAPQLFE